MTDAVDAIVDAWCARDETRALLPADRDAIAASQAARALVIERLRADPPHPDLFSACAVLGRILAERGASPTLAGASVDNLTDALTSAGAAASGRALLADVRAALLEGYCATREENERRAASAAWEYPRCAVPLPDGTVALLPGYPGDDGEAIAGWAGRVAHGVAMAGARRAIVAEAPEGRASARAALVDALALAGVEVIGATRPSRSRAWLPWRRARDAR